MQDSDFLESEVMKRKYGETVLFDDRVGLTGWKGSRSEEENAKLKLRGKATIPDCQKSKTPTPTPKNHTYQPV